MTRFPIDGTGRLASEREHPTAALTGPAGGDLTGSYPNPTVATINVGGVDVLGLSANPSGVTDWGPLINTAYTGGARYFKFRPPAGQATFEFPFSTQLAFDNSLSVVLEGTNGLMWNQDVELSARSPVLLRWKGSGSTSPISAKLSGSFVFRDLGLNWDNSGGAFTGIPINLTPSAGGVTVAAHFERADITPYNHSTRTASRAISLDGVISSNINYCRVGGAAYGIIGEDGTGINNVNVIRGGVFFNCGSALFANLWEGFRIESVICELGDFGNGQTPLVMGFTAAFIAADRRVNGEVVSLSTWDQATAATLFSFPRKVHADVTFDGGFLNVIGSGAVPIFQFKGGGHLKIIRVSVSPGTPCPIVDLGDVPGGDTPFESVDIDAYWAGGAISETIINRDGHQSVNIRAANDSRALGQLSIPGHVSNDYVASQGTPAVTLLPAAGTGASFGFIAGNDFCGHMYVVPGTGPTTGDVFKLTFAKTYTKASGTQVSGGQLAIFIFPRYYTGTYDWKLFQSTTSDPGAGGNLGEVIVAAGAVPSGPIEFNYMVVAI